MSDDTELNFILTVEDELTGGAEEAKGSLDDLVASPYEGELSIAATVDDEATGALESINRAATATVVNLDDMTLASGDVSKALEDVTSAARGGADELDSLSQTQSLAAGAISDTADASSDASDQLNDAANAATVAGSAASGAAGGSRALMGAVKMLGKEAGVSKAALGEMNVAMRLGSVGSKLMADGGLSLAMTLGKLGGYAAIAAAVIAGTAAAWKSNFGSIRDIAMGVRLSVEQSFSSIGRSIEGAGTHIKNAAKENSLWGKSVDFFIVAPAKAAEYWFKRVTTSMGETGAMHNQITAATERMAAATDRVKTAIQKEREEYDKLNDATREMEEANLRITDVGNAQERAHLGVERAARTLAKAQENLTKLQQGSVAPVEDLNAASLDVEKANLGVDQAQQSVVNSQQKLNDLRASGTATANDIHDAELDVKNAQLGVESAAQQVISATQKLSDLRNSTGKGSAQDIADAELDVRDAELGTKEASQNLVHATRDVSLAWDDSAKSIYKFNDQQEISQDASKKSTDANNEQRDALKELEDRANVLNAAIALLSSSSSDEWRIMAEQAEAEAKRIKAAMDLIDPTIQHSPSMVDRVETGVDEMLGHYRRFSSGMQATPLKPAEPAFVQQPGNRFSDANGGATIYQFPNLREFKIVADHTTTYEEIMRKFEQHISRMGY